MIECCVVSFLNSMLLSKVFIRMLLVESRHPPHAMLVLVASSLKMSFPAGVLNMVCTRQVILFCFSQQ